MSRGFNTKGAGGLNDVITGALTSMPVKSTMFVWVNPSGPGTNGGFARVAQLGNTAPKRYIFDFNGNANSMLLIVPWSTTAGNFTIATGPPLNTWSPLIVSYDGSSTANIPSIYIKGVAASVTTGTTPVGAFSSDTVNILIGNLAAGNQTWDGLMAHFAIWNTNLNAAEAMALSSGINPLLIRPENLVSYLPLDGINNPETDLILGNTTSITGTRLGTSEPPAMSVLQAMPYLYDPTINTQGGTTYNDFITESSSSADSENATANDNASLSEAGISSDSEIASANSNNAISENGASSDLVNGFLTVGGNLTEQLISGDSFTGIASDNANFVETDAASDSYSLPTVYSDSLTEIVIANDNYQDTTGINAIAPQTGSGSDSWRKYLDWLAKKKKAEFKKKASRAGIKEVMANKIAELATSEVLKLEASLSIPYYELLDSGEQEARLASQQAINDVYEEVWRQIGVQKRKIVDLKIDLQRKQDLIDEEELFLMVM